MANPNKTKRLGRPKRLGKVYAQGIESTSKRGRALEQEIQFLYESSGWETIKQGMPDMVCFRWTDGHWQLRFVECKLGLGNLRPCQRRAHRLLKQLGFEVIVATNAQTAGAPWLQVSK